MSPDASPVTFGTVMFNWQRPTAPGAMNACAWATVDPNVTWSGDASVRNPLTTCPAGLAGVVGPHPTAKIVITSPGRAGRNGNPWIKLVRPTNVVKSWYCATTYCLPPMLNAGGANSAGDTFVLFSVAALLLPDAVSTSMFTLPNASSSGACTLIWFGLMKYTNAGLPLMFTRTPSSAVGACVPLLEKSPPPHGRVF